MSSSVMPKGVEHTLAAPTATTDDGVSSSVMPKGVEHTIPWTGWALLDECRVQ